MFPKSDLFTISVFEGIIKTENVIQAFFVLLTAPPNAEYGNQARDFSMVKNNKNTGFRGTKFQIITF